MTSDELYMQRCIELARLGAGSVSPNPMVGAVLVNKGRIIGEGYHQRYGGPHAEVNCIHSVQEQDLHLIPSSTLYVSLEPCAHFGKTPPCADLIIRHAIPICKIGCRDPFDAVNGKGIEKLIAAGVEVETGLLEEKCQELNRRFFTWQVHKRPFIVLKWAQTADGFIGYNHRQENNSRNIEVPFEEDQTSRRLMVSNEYTSRLVHKWRSEEAAILVGTNTALQDDPSLTNRHWPGTSPLRLVLDMQLRLPSYLQLFTDGSRTVIFNGVKSGEENNCQFYQLDKNKSIIPQMLEALYVLGIQSVLVEGGARLLQSFIDNDVWDEGRVITNTKQAFLATENAGCRAPVLRSFTGSSLYQFSDDQVQLFKPLAR